MNQIKGKSLIPSKFSKIVKSLNPWSLYTFGYLMGQFFHNKYVVFYGLPIAVAKFENINAPGLPKCIGRIHLYSNMWKYFDQGLYEFLFTWVSQWSSIRKYVEIFVLSVTFIHHYAKRHLRSTEKYSLVSLHLPSFTCGMEFTYSCSFGR